MSAASLITAWLLGAINAWGASPIPPSEQPRVDEVRARVADAIIAVAYDETEPPIYQGTHGRARTALLLASIAALESRFIERVITGHCLDWECDHKLAIGLYQLHVGKFGIRFTGARAARCFAPGPDCYTALDLADDLTLQTRAGLRMYRTQGVRAYTTGPAAVSQANAWVVGHAVPVADSDVMSAAGVADE